MESSWYRRKAAELGVSVRSAATETQRREWECDQQNWLRIANQVDQREAAIGKGRRVHSLSLLAKNYFDLAVNLVR
jgi:hypothetical protein